MITVQPWTPSSRCCAPSAPGTRTGTYTTCSRRWGELPDGRDHAVVYADLLHVVPAQLHWLSAGELLPGALVEVVAEPAVSVHLRRCARTLEADLVHSPFGSDAALIGQVAHVFQELARRTPGSTAPSSPAPTRPARSSCAWPRPRSGPLRRGRQGPDRSPGSATGATGGGTAVNPTRAVRALVGAALKADGSPTVPRPGAHVRAGHGQPRCSALGGARRPVRPGRALDRVAVARRTVVRRGLRGRTRRRSGDHARLRHAVLWRSRTTSRTARRPCSASTSRERCRSTTSTVATASCTLLERKPLAEVFDTVVELVDVLPELCGTVRERRPRVGQCL